MVIVIKHVHSRHVLVYCSNDLSRVWWVKGWVMLFLAYSKCLIYLNMNPANTEWGIEAILCGKTSLQVAAYGKFLNAPLTQYPLRNWEIFPIICVLILHIIKCLQLLCKINYYVCAPTWEKSMLIVAGLLSGLRVNLFKVKCSISSWDWGYAYGGNMLIYMQAVALQPDLYTE